MFSKPESIEKAIWLHAENARLAPAKLFWEVASSRHIFQPEEVKLRDLLEFVMDRPMNLPQVFSDSIIAEKTFQIRLHGCHVHHRGTVLLFQWTDLPGQGKTSSSK